MGYPKKKLRYDSISEPTNNHNIDLHFPLFFHYDRLYANIIFISFSFWDDFVIHIPRHAHHYYILSASATGNSNAPEHASAKVTRVFTTARDI